MHLVWKRPDGYLGAKPSDFVVCELADHSNLWLHKVDKDQYPFRVSGGWEDIDLSVSLNNLVNLIPAEDSAWVDHLNNCFDHSMDDSKSDYLATTLKWLGELEKVAKGDTWEVEILEQAVAVVIARVKKIQDDFLK